MQNLFQVVDWLSAEVLRSLINKLYVAECFNTDYNQDFEKEFPVGSTVRVPLPQRWLIRDGIGYNPQPVNAIYTTVSCDQIFGVDFEWDSAEAALQAPRGMERIKKQYLDKAGEQLAQEIDSRAARFAYLNTSNIVGVLGTNPSDTNFAGAARQRLIEQACPPGELSMIISPGAMTSVTNGSTTLFNPQDEVAKAFKEGYYGRARGFDWSESMSLYSHTAGVWATPASVTVDGSGQSGNTLLINCTSGDTFNRGDVFNIAAVNAANPSTRRSTGTLKQFVITNDTVATGATVTIPIYPAIVGPGQYQNVDALPLDAALLTLFPGTTTPSTGPKSGTQGLALHRDAFALVGVKLEVPKAVEFSSLQRDPKTGIAVRFVRMFDPIQSKMVNRFDVLMGFGVLYGDNCAVRCQLQ